MKTKKGRIGRFFIFTATVVLSAANLIMGSTYSGTVVDIGTNIPIPGVRVSIGFTDTVTYTDQNGFFSFKESSGIKKIPSFIKSQPLFITKTSAGTIIDFKNCQSVTTLKLFDLSGKCLYETNITDLNRTIQLPNTSIGMHIIQLLSDNYVTSVFKWSSINGAQSTYIPVRYYSSHHRSAASSPNTKKILFRHDAYYPVELDENVTLPKIMMKLDPRCEVFNQKKIGRYDFTLANTDSLLMEKNALLENYVPAEFSYNNVPFGKVGLRYKGSSYSLPNCFEDDGTRKVKPECNKISFKIKFDQYIDSLRFYKLKKLNLHSESIDGSKMHDILSYELFREMGITAPRCAFAEVYLNEVFQGLYCAVEDVDGRFTDARWPNDGNGNLFKEKWPISDIPKYYKDGLVTNDKPEDSADVSRMVAFYQAVKNSDAATFTNQVSPFFDFDYWLHYIAVDRVIHNADGVMTWYAQPEWFSNHNYYLYQKAAGEKLWIIPWDLHVTFGKKDPIVDAMGVPDWNVEPVSCEPDSILWGNQLGVPAHCDKLTGLTADVFWNDFVKISEKMLKTCFDVSYIQGKVDFYKKLIDTVIQKDPYVDQNLWVGQVNALKGDIAVLNSDFDDYIHKRTIIEDTSGYTAPFDGSTGHLVTDKINNFEITPIGNEKTWSYYYVSENSSITVKHDTIYPIWGKANVLYSSVFNPAPGEGQYIEWGRIFLKFKKATDLTGLKEIRVNLQSDSNRDFWMFIASSEYSKNDVATEYGWWEPTSSKGSLHVFTLKSIGYPSWATGNLPDILKNVLSNASAIGFSSNPHFNANGELATVPDSGYLRIDNIRFVF